MLVNKVFISINAEDFDILSKWWSTFLGRKWDRQPMPSCHEWDLTKSVLFQVLDNPKVQNSTTVTLHVPDLEAEMERLGTLGIEVQAPSKVEGFNTLRFTQFADPEGNIVGLLDGV